MKTNLKYLLVATIIFTIFLSGCTLFGPPEEIIDKKNTFSFEYNCSMHEIELNLATNNYKYYKNKNNNYFFYDDEKYYTSLTKQKDDARLIKEIIAEIETEIKSENSEDVAIAVISFVQFIDYDCEKYNKFTKPNTTERFKINFPYETLYEQKGVCGDSSILLSKILGELGYATSFLVYDNENHMAIGIECDEKYSDYSSNLCYIETTGPSRIGVKPKSLNLTNVEIIKASVGKPLLSIKKIKEEQAKSKAEYGEDILSVSTCKEIEYYKKIRNIDDNKKNIDIRLLENKKDTDYIYTNDVLQSENTLKEITKRSELKRKAIEEESLIHSEKQTEYYKEDCDKIIDKKQYDKCVIIYNQLENIRKKYNSLVEEYNALLKEYNINYEIYTEKYNLYKNAYEEYFSTLNEYNNAVEELNLNIDLYNNETHRYYANCSIAKNYNPSTEDEIEAEKINIIENNNSTIK